MIRHLITSEYPPQTGGVSDYTELVAAELAATGDEVHVWCPGPTPDNGEAMNNPAASSASVLIHRVLGRFTPADLRRTGKQLDQFSAPRRLLVQWVPHGYGYRSMNLVFCLWLWQRAKLKGDHLELMVHEPFLAFGEGSRKQDVAAAAHRLMVAFLLNAARRVWVSIPEWEKLLRPLAADKMKSFAWLPVPSNIPVIDDTDSVAMVRAQYALPGAPLVGHFGTYNHYTIELMSRLLPELLTGQPELSMLLVGQGSFEARDHLIVRSAGLAGRLHSTGALTPEQLSLHISACDVMLQPYQDGVSGRRTSVMTALAHGVAAVTTTGKATEEVWIESQAVVLTPVGDVNAMVAATQSLLADDEQRMSIGKFASRLYRDRFDVQHTIAALRGEANVALPPLQKTGSSASQ